MANMAAITRGVFNDLSGYDMVTATLEDAEVQFPSDDAFQEAISVGFFRIKAPEDMDLEAGRSFARTFTSNPKYQDFGTLSVVDGLLRSKIAQTVRFTLERDHWNKCHIGGKEVEEGEPNYPEDIQKLGHQMHDIGVKILQCILRKFAVSEELWFEATGGSALGEGSHFLLFNCYDPKNGAEKADGVGPHKDWGYITVLDAVEPGLEARIGSVWRAVHTEDGYLTINFGYPLEKLLPRVKAAAHRVITQKEKMRTSTVAFIDPRVGAFRKGSGYPGEGMVYDWNEQSAQLINPESAISFFTRLSKTLYGEDQGSSTVEEEKE